MLNIELVENLYARLSKARQEHLNIMLFGKEDVDLSTFLRSNDIGLSKLETLADYFRMPLESFRKDSTFNMAHSMGNNRVGNVIIQEDESLALEREALKKEIEELQAEIDAKSAELKAKDKKIDELKAILAAMK